MLIETLKGWGSKKTPTTFTETMDELNLEMARREEDRAMIELFTPDEDAPDNPTVLPATIVKRWALIAGLVLLYVALYGSDLLAT